MSVNYEQRSSVQTQCMDHCISDDDDVVDPALPIRHSSPANLAHTYKVSRQEADSGITDKSMTSSFSSSTFSSAASKRDSIYSIARSSTVASSINEQVVANVDVENKKRWSVGSWSSLDDITMSPQKMSLAPLKPAPVAHPTISKTTIDSQTVAIQADMRRSPVPNPSIMSVLRPRTETEVPTSPVRYNTPMYHPHDQYGQVDHLTHTHSHSSTECSAASSGGSSTRMSWDSSFNMPVTYSGWLLKHNATHFTFTTPWKRYYYVLSEHILHEYKTDKPDSPHREQLDLSGDTLVFINEGFPGKPFVVEIRKPGHRMCLQCTDLETMKQWMYHLKKSIAQVRRNEYLKAVAEETHTRSTPPNHSSTDIVLVPNSPNVTEKLNNTTTSPTTTHINHTPNNHSRMNSTSASTSTSTVRYRSKSEQSSKSPLSQSSNKSVAIPPQRPPPSHSPPPIPNM